MKSVFFSIIIPLYNKREYIKSTIDSVLKQSYSNYEIIVVDDGSTDESPQIVKSINNPHINFYSKNNGGVSSARNFGIQKSKGDYICFLDSDDLWKANYLDTLNNIITQHSNIDMICSAYAVFKEEPQNFLWIRKLNTCDEKSAFKIDFFLLCLKHKGCIALTSATCIKKRMIEENDLSFKEGISLGEDIDFWVRIACLSKNIFYNNQVQVLYRFEANNSLSFNKNKMNMYYPYWNWYDTEYMQKSNVKKFTTRMIYTLCREGYKRKEYSSVIPTIKKSRGSYLFISRLGLLILSKIKKYASQN